MKNFLPYAFHKWEWKKFEEANMSIATHALHYWIGAFLGIRAIPSNDGSWDVLLFRIDRHSKRLADSARYLHADFTAEYIEEKIKEFIVKNKVNKPIYIRPLVYTSDLDLSPRLHNIEKDFLIYGLELWDYFSTDGITCTISSYMRQSDSSFPLRWKITWAYIVSAMAKTEAIERWFDDAILLNDSNKVSEGSASNIFIVREGIIYTPPVSEDILEWITRDSVINLARSKWYEVIERKIDKTELYIADEVFMTWTAARVTPVSKIEHFRLPNNRPIYDDLKKAFEDVVSWKDNNFSDWITRVKI